MDTSLRSFRQTASRFIADDCPQMAAAISYYALFSLFPLLILLVSLAGVFLRDDTLRRELVDEVMKNIPLDQGEGRDAVGDAISGTSKGSAAIGIIGLAGMAWSGSAVFGAIRRALNKVFRDTPWKRPFVRQKLVDLAMVFAVGLFFLTSIATTAALRIVRAHGAQLAGLGDFSERVALPWDVASFVAPLALSFAAFAFLYALVPARRRRLAEVWPGAILAAALFEVAKMSFSLYLEHIADFELVYGSLGAVLALMFWIYVSSNVMLLGAELAVVATNLPQLEGERPRGPSTSIRAAAAQLIRNLFVSDPRGGGSDFERGEQPRQH